MRPSIIRAVFVGSLVLSGGCAKPVLNLTERAAERVKAQPLRGMPYHPLVFQLDLTILSYHLYAQSLLWPFDPYYEDADDRDEAMAKVWTWAAKLGRRQGEAGLEAIRGPGALAGLPSNKLHDPILYRYSGVDPKASALSSDGSVWLEFTPIAKIADRIGEVWVSRRAYGAATGTVGPINSASVQVLRVDTPTTGRVELPSDGKAPTPTANGKPDARDLLLAFEGATGDKGEQGQPHSQSLMGFVLVREVGDAYDIHIVFRGSRSGNSGRAAWQASGTEDASGNPDWITDLGFRLERRPVISAEPGHEVSRGMAHSTEWTAPQILAGLDRLVGSRRERAPRIITVAGHSLGGALAQCFASAVLMGQRYGPGGEGMPASLRAWPWKNLKLVTVGAPRIGNALWAEELTTGRLESRYYDTHLLTPFDVRASGLTGIDIVPRMTNPDRPVALRVLIPSDAITSGRPMGEHVGHSVYLEHPTFFSIADTDSHEPQRMRLLMLETLRDPRIPPAPWVYQDLEALAKTRGEGEIGDATEYRKCANAVQSRRAKDGRPWNSALFTADLEVFLELVVPKPE